MHNDLEQQSVEQQIGTERMIIYLLEDISNKMSQLLDSVGAMNIYGQGGGGGGDESKQLQGRQDFFEGQASAEKTRLTPQNPSDRWYSVYVKNTGNNKLFFTTNGLSPNSDTPYISPGNTFQFAPKRKVIENVQLWTPPNTTTTYWVFLAL